jgi:dTMP kinase
MQSEIYGTPTNLDYSGSRDMRERGFLIAVEGIDGCGKTTQSYLLVEKLRKLGYKAAYTTEPTHGVVGTVIRQHISRGKFRFAVYEALLFAADRYEHVKKTIKPKLSQGTIIVSDRYLYSSLAYQGALGLNIKWLREINFFAPRPDLTIYIDVPPETGLKRKTGEKTVFEKLKYELKIRNLYHRLAKTDGFVIIDGTEGVSEVHRKIYSTVLNFLKKKKGLEKPRSSSVSGL